MSMLLLLVLISAATGRILHTQETNSDQNLLYYEALIEK